MAMIFYTSETEMFIPQQYNEQTLRLTHRALENHARFQMLLNVVLDRDFSHLWHAPALLQMFRHWCTLCGAWFHTAALMTHQLTHHHDACVWAAQLKFQLVQCMHKTISANSANCFSMTARLTQTQQLNVLNNCRSILPRTAPSSSKLPLCCSHSMDDQLMLDQSDTELLQSFQHLGPLLMQASQYMREKDEEPLNKKLKQEPVGADKAAQPHNPQKNA